MAKLRVHNFSISLDGYGAGPAQTREEPLGVGGEDLHRWFLPTKTFRAMSGEEGGSEGLDEQFAAAGDVNIGATIMGRNMFGPIRGEWGDEDGGAGGVTIRRTTIRRSCSPITRGNRSRWRAARSSTS